MKVFKRSGWVMNGLCIGLALVFVWAMFKPAGENISKETFEGTWPFTVPQGKIVCGPSNALGFKSGGVIYGLSGRGNRHYSNIDPIWSPDPRIKSDQEFGELFAGRKVNIYDVASYGREYCGD